MRACGLSALGEGLAPQAEHHAELCEARRQGGIAPAVVKAARGVGVGQEAALAQRYRDAGDGDDGEEGHLEAGLEESARRPDEDDERGGAEGVERIALAREQAGDEEDGGHQQRALHGDAEAGEQRVGEGQGEREQRREAFAEMQAAGEPEEQAGEQRDVHSGDDEEVEGAGALEAERAVGG